MKGDKKMSGIKDLLVDKYSKQVGNVNAYIYVPKNENVGKKEIYSQLDGMIARGLRK